MKHALRGWMISGIGRRQTGAPLTITANTSIGTRRADYIGGPVLVPEDERGPDNWLNPAAFAPAADDRRGNVGVGIARGPGLYLFDVSLRKQFRFGSREHYNIQFQVDAFNILNHVNFRNPQVNWSNAEFGSITTAGPARSMQLALRFNF
jgi:hypothetical protein